MELIMELIVEILLEMVFEGTLETGTSKKVPMPVRILCLVIFLLLIGGFLFFMAFITLEIIKKNIALGCIFVLFDLFLLGCVVYAIRKKIKDH